jgi:carbamate kinase
MSDRPTLVVALGGNALLRRGERPEPVVQAERAAAAMVALAPLAASHRLVITHGNGPQVGLLAQEIPRDVSPAGLDVLDAETEGWIGYLLEQGLENACGAPVATVLTQTLVDPDDPAFGRPEKPIGPLLDSATAHRLAVERGWFVGRDGEGWRRLVPSPQPQAIIEKRAIELLLDGGVVVVCGGGGGIPVVAEHGRLRGVSAVIDKDLTAALIARDLRADALVLLTDVAGVLDGWGTEGARLVRRLPVSVARRSAFAAGTMGPKVEACCRFVEGGGRFAAIGALDDAEAVVAGILGTTIVREGVLELSEPSTTAR